MSDHPGYFQEADWKKQLKKEIFGDILGKIEVCEKEIENLSKRLDVRTEQNAQAATLAYENLESKTNAALGELSKRVSRIEKELGE